MDVVKLPKKFRVVCYEVMDGKDGALDTLETFADKYPHQVAAVKAEVVYFNLDYEQALDLDLTVLPWLEEWYYSNVSNEHMTAMAVAALRLHREQELMEALTKEQARIREENGRPQRDRFCDILMDYLKRGVMPFSDNDKNYPYREPEEPQTKEQLWEKLAEQNKKLSLDDPDTKRKLYNHCCMFGTARWVKGDGFPQTEDNKAKNELLAALTPEQKEVLAGLLQEEHIAGIHTTLAYLNKMMDLDGLELHQDEVSLNQAVRWELIARNPVLRATLPKEEQ